MVKERTSRRDRRQRPARRPFPAIPGKDPETQLEDFDECRALALNIVHATLTRDHPEEHARVVSAIFTVIDRPPETVSSVIGYLAQVVAEHFQFGCGSKIAAVEQIERQLSELSAAAPAGADSTEAS